MGPQTKGAEEMTNYREVLNGLMQDESGQDLIEYALVAALIGLAAITGMKNVATGVSTAFNSISSNLTSAI
jgi:pilus assembly protein Flp/PilA